MKNRKNIRFTKYHGTGNDFIMLDSRKVDMTDRSVETIAGLCDRHFGIGADGLIILDPSEEHDFRMTYFNSDGRPGSMCGNGGRCTTAFAHEQGWIAGDCRFEAADGLHSGTILPDGRIELSLNDVAGVEQLHLSINELTGNHGSAVSPPEPAQAAKAASEEANPDQEISNRTDAGTTNSRMAAPEPPDKGSAASEGSRPDPAGIIEKTPGYLLDTGSPHLVIFVDDVAQLDVFTLGRKLRNDPQFTDGVNVNFVERTATGIRVRTYERGVENETLSCGTGVTAAAIAASLHWPQIDPPVKVNTLGGELEVAFSAAPADTAKENPRFSGITLSGPATRVFEGTFGGQGGRS